MEVDHTALGNGGSRLEIPFAFKFRYNSRQNVSASVAALHMLATLGIQVVQLGMSEPAQHRTMMGGSSGEDR